jgi:type I restriction enzyme S subunit
MDGLLNISFEEYTSVSVLVPEIEEQNKVADFFCNLDNLITLHQRKYEQMSNVKISVLEKLFIHGDEVQPQLRFQTYTKSWEERTLRGIVSEYTDYVTTPSDGYYRLGIRSHTNGTFYDYVPPEAKLGEKKLQVVKRDNFIVNIVFAWEHAIAVTTAEDEGKLVSHRFPQFSFNEGMYPRFFHYALGDKRFQHHLWLASPSGAGRNKTLRIEEMLDFKLYVPEYNEQKQIADFLDSLDELIRLYALRVEKLKNIKAACLEGMIV